MSGDSHDWFLSGVCPLAPRIVLVQVLFKELQSEEGYRARVGNYRILYTIDNGAVVVEVFRVGHRREVYRGL
ncbi:type II toxin-antitoxin system RelE/ParE family toxin [Rothia mucilaginosa]|uniref:type II toxin-antitoxin system RelE family toxin n=1 Tax=Rothia TaxID=32207 RepID=UPI0028E52C7E|nr:type II toxin-antitoxin system RelE/ParE family toxin [Rothia mucilaginosa]